MTQRQHLYSFPTPDELREARHAAVQRSIDYLVACIRRHLQDVTDGPRKTCALVRVSQRHSKESLSLALAYLEPDLAASHWTASGEISKNNADNFLVTLTPIIETDSPE